ncbi:hypothetical protein [Planctomycetes bacterium Pan216]
MTLLFPFVLIIVAVVLSYWIQRQRQAQKKRLYSHSKLLAELVEAHKLSPTERTSILDLAQRTSVRYADSLFVRPDLYAEAIQSWRDDHPGRSTTELEKLQDKLFATSSMDSKLT